MGILKLDMDRVRENAADWKDSIGACQVVVYTMCGGGFLGKFAAEQPADFYIDSRCGRFGFGRRAIEQAVNVLAVIAEANGLDPHHMPAMPRLHNLGVF